MNGKKGKRKIRKIGKTLVFLVLFFFSCPGLSLGDIYMYVDERGIVRFSNTPTSSSYKLFMKEKEEKNILHLGPLSSYDDTIRIAANYHGMDPLLIKAVIRAESSFNPKALSPKGAKGLMQLMPETIKDLGVKDPFHPRENIMAGTRYLRMMLDAFDGEIHLALAAYNAGPSTVRRYGGVPPFPETQSYIQRVIDFWEKYKL